MVLQVGVIQGGGHGEAVGLGEGIHHRLEGDPLLEGGGGGLLGAAGGGGEKEHGGQEQGDDTLHFHSQGPFLPARGRVFFIFGRHSLPAFT